MDIIYLGEIPQISTIVPDLLEVSWLLTLASCFFRNKTSVSCSRSFSLYSPCYVAGQEDHATLAAVMEIVDFNDAISATYLYCRPPSFAMLCETSFGATSSALLLYY